MKDLEKIKDAVLESLGELIAEEIFKYIKLIIKIYDKIDFEKLEDHVIFSRELVGNNNIDVELRQDLLNRQMNIRYLIATAASINEESYYMLSVSKANENYDLIGEAKKRAVSIVESRRKINLTVYQLKSMIEYFIKINNEIKEKILEPNNENNEYIERLKNALLSFEMLDFIYDYLENFTLSGKDELLSLRDKIVNNLQRTRERDDNILKEKLTGTSLESTTKNIESNINKRRKYIDKVIESWGKSVDDIDLLELKIKEVRAILPDIDAYREDTISQIEILLNIPPLKFLEFNITILESLKNIDFNFLEPLPDDLSLLSNGIRKS